MRSGSYTPVDDPFAFLRRAGDGALALAPTCTYGPCRLRYVEATDALVCACHGCVYDDEGRPRSGPTERPLRRLATRVVDGVVFVRVD